MQANFEILKQIAPIRKEGMRIYVWRVTFGNVKRGLGGDVEGLSGVSLFVSLSCVCSSCILFRSWFPFSCLILWNKDVVKVIFSVALQGPSCQMDRKDCRDPILTVNAPIQPSYNCLIGWGALCALTDDSGAFSLGANGVLLMLSFCQSSWGSASKSTLSCDIAFPWAFQHHCCFLLVSSTLGLPRFPYCPFVFVCISAKIMPRDFSIPSVVTCHSEDSISYFLNHFTSFKVLTFSILPHSAILPTLA